RFIWRRKERRKSGGQFRLGGGLLLQEIEHLPLPACHTVFFQGRSKLLVNQRIHQFQPVTQGACSVHGISLAMMPTRIESMSETSARGRLKELIQEFAIVRGKVILSSGKEADYYIDLRRVTLQQEASGLVGQVMLDLLDEAKLEFSNVGGLTMGADPVGTAIKIGRASCRKERRCGW